ncbi:hypothetical protein [Victivallis sp. Marseille-Q1083]|uniref:hypothetical protein n=1 Tax=Victivallis sp. Marseille-Q1083 TaxID=2717288 RepID=UPI0020CA69AF|nr:hypothetical protein [Victivallis sp. Marseille-Q1083]
MKKINFFDFSPSLHFGRHCLPLGLMVWCLMFYFLFLLNVAIRFYKNFQRRGKNFYIFLILDIDLLRKICYNFLKSERKMFARLLKSLRRLCWQSMKSNLYRKELENEKTEIHTDRTARRDRYYRHPGQHVAAGARQSQAGGADHQMH